MKKLFAGRNLLFLIFVGCATIMRPGPDRIPVDSYPKRGARVYLDGELVGVTPVTVAVPRKSECVIRVELDGYHPVIIDRDKKLNGWFLGNLLLGGLIGITVDLVTSNQGLYSQEPIVVQLTAISEDERSETFVIPIKPIAMNP